MRWIAVNTVAAAVLALAHAGAAWGATKAPAAARSADDALIPAALGSATTRPAWSAYEVVVQRSIFLRDRTRPRSRPSGDTTSRPAPVRAEQMIVLSGVAYQDGRYVAFVEDRRSGTTSRLQVGDRLASGRVGAIEIGSIQYITDVGAATVNVGNNLDNGQAATTGSAGAAAVGNGASTAPTGDADAVIERMRLRRQQELGR